MWGSEHFLSKQSGEKKANRQLNLIIFSNSVTSQLNANIIDKNLIEF